MTSARRVPKTEDIAPSARLPELVASNPPLHVGLFVLVAFAIVVWWVLRRTTFGFATITTGTNPHAAHYAGINVNRIIILSMTLAGGVRRDLGGRGGRRHRPTRSSPAAFAGIGFDGIAIALLARANPLGILAASFLWGSLLDGAPLMQQDAGVSIDVVRIIQAMVLLFVAADGIVRWVFRLRNAAGRHARRAGIGMELDVNGRRERTVPHERRDDRPAPRRARRRALRDGDQRGRGGAALRAPPDPGG